MNEQERIENSINTRVKRHFGGFHDLHSLEHTSDMYQVDNYCVQMKRYIEERLKDAVVFGIKAQRRYETAKHQDLQRDARFKADGEFEGIDAVSAIYEKIITDENETELGLSNALILFHHEGRPAVICFLVSRDRIEQNASMVVLSRSMQDADRILTDFLEFENLNSIYRHRIIRPRIDYAGEIVTARLVPHEKASWDQVVLRPDVKRLITENVLDYIRHADTIRRNGFELKRGVIFHGKPGVGKSLVCRVLASELKEFTTILMTGTNLRNAIGGFKLARKYKPSLIIFEDIDLVAKDRADNADSIVLGELMNELDGLSSRDNVFAIFTTNNLRFLERALVDRPGRVDIAIEFPLPDAAMRMELIRLYAHKAILDMEDFSPIIEATEETTPAFIKELLKKTLLCAIRDNSLNADGLAILKKHHFERSIKELKSIENPSALKVMGFR